MLQFNAATNRLLDNAYRGSDIVRRRLAVLEMLAPRVGDTVLDIGSGLGHFATELSRAVGEQGKVIGVDPSPDMRRSATGECEPFANVRILEGTAEALPLEDGSVDRAASIQVFEYVRDIPAALAEARRVLRPGGRLVIGDMHWDSWIWHSDEPARMRRMMQAWDHHLADRCVPAKLPQLMREAGYEVEGTRPVVFLDTDLRNDGLAQMHMSVLPDYVLQNGLMDEPTVRAWAEEQRELAAAGRFFFCLVHFIVSGRRRA